MNLVILGLNFTELVFVQMDFSILIKMFKIFLKTILKIFLLMFQLMGLKCFMTCVEFNLMVKVLMILQWLHPVCRSASLMEP